MNTENHNETNNNDTVEQNQNPGAPASDLITPPELTTGPALITNDCPPADPAPTTDSSETSDSSDNTLATELQTQNSELETQDQSAQPEPPTSVPALSAELITAPALITDNCPPPTPAEPVKLETRDLGLQIVSPTPATHDGQRTTDKTHKPRKRSSRPRVGKVAKLPEELRNFVNEQILRGISFEYIKTVLKEKGYPGISASNLSRWKLGGYREWILNQESAAAQLARREEALKLAREKGSDLEEATIQLALARYHSFFAKVDLAAMEPQLADNPEHIIGLIRGLSHLVTANRALKQKQAVISHPGRPGRPAAARDLTDFESQEKNGGLTEETLKKITTAIKLF